MTRLSEIINELEHFAPPMLKEPWDNVGLMVGDETQIIEKVFVCLDITSENLRQATAFGADLIISHHPLIFTPLRSVTENDPITSIIRTAIKNDISIYSMHTNFDKTDGGMNDLLAEKLGLENIRPFTSDECIDGEGTPFSPIGRVGTLEFPMPLEDFARQTKAVLGCAALKYSGDLSDIVETVALCSGSGGRECMYAAYHSGADVYLTADLKHDIAMTAHELGLNMIDAGHFETENIICEFLEEFFAAHFPELEIKASEAEPFYSSL